MVEPALVYVFGIPLGTPFQGMTAAGVLSIAGLALRTWIAGIPERLRVANEAKVIDNSTAVVFREEYATLNRQNRDDIHFLKNQLAKVMAEQIDCAKELSEAHAINRANRDDMRTMMFLIRLLISEVKRLDPDPDNNIIIKQCDEIINELESRSHASVVYPEKNGKSGAVIDAKQTLASTKETCNEVKAEEAKK